MRIEGYLQERPELYFTSSGKAVCNFRIDRKRFVAWEELAENIFQHIKAGDKLKIFGYEKLRWWTDTEGEKKSEMEFTVTRIQVTERPKPIGDCCYHCLHMEVDCMKGCYNALGGPSYMEGVCKIEDGRCAEEHIDHKECFEVRA